MIFFVAQIPMTGPQVNLWNDFAAPAKPIQITLYAKKSARKCFVRWQKPDLARKLFTILYYIINFYFKLKIHNHILSIFITRKLSKIQLIWNVMFLNIPLTPSLANGTLVSIESRMLVASILLKEISAFELVSIFLLYSTHNVTFQLFRCLKWCSYTNVLFDIVK